MSLFKWWKELRAANTPTPVPPFLYYQGTIAESGGTPPILTDEINPNLTIQTDRLSQGVYRLFGFPAGYTITPYLCDYIAGKSTSVTWADPYVYIESYNTDGDPEDDQLNDNRIGLILKTP